jgi:hypothetical protein
MVLVEWLAARGSRNSMACRRIAPPGFRAAPHAANGGPFGFNPSRLRACGAARSACGHSDALGRVALFQHGLELLAHRASSSSALCVSSPA